MKPIILISTLFISLSALTGCTSAENILSGIDYGCADIDGYFTDSNGRAIKVPEGTELTPELVAALCP